MAKPKAVPPFPSRHSTSLNTITCKGGKPIPSFHRPQSLLQPAPLKSDLAPKDSLEITVSGQLQPVHLKPPRGSKRAHTEVSATVFPAGLLERWMCLVRDLGQLSKVWQDYNSSPNFDSHCSRLLQKFAVSTVLKYITTLQSIGMILFDFQLSWSDIGTHHLPDILQLAHEGRSTDFGFGASSAIKALRWVQKVLNIECFHILHEPVVSSFLQSGHHERREAVPLCLYIVIQLERRILMRECSLLEQILIGGFLTMLWGGLRFADGQRIYLSSLSWCITALRGSCYQTKTTKSGQPWAIQASGFLSHGDFSWVAKYLQALDTLWGLHPPLQSADFLLPMTDGNNFLTPLTPMSYTVALQWFRFFCTLPWKQSGPHSQIDPASYTLHSLKTTILSWSNQLAQKGLVTEEQRHLQGHHRRGSMRLYSRDDTAGQLALQHTLITQVQHGFRFVTPLHRGSQQPLLEPTVTLEKFSKPLATYVWKFFPFGHCIKDPIVEGLSHSSTVPEHPEPQGTSDMVSSTDSDSDSASSSSSSASTMVQKASAATALATNDQCEELITARTTKVQHVMLVSEDLDNQGCHEWDGRFFRAACGNRLAGSKVVFSTQMHPAFLICRHSACFKHWCNISCGNLRMK